MGIVLEAKTNTTLSVTKESSGDGSGGVSRVSVGGKGIRWLESTAGNHAFHE